MRCPDGLAAGTYHLKLEKDWGNNAKADTYWQFTLTKAVPAADQYMDSHRCRTLRRATGKQPLRLQTGSPQLKPWQLHPDQTEQIWEPCSTQPETEILTVCRISIRMESLEILSGPSVAQFNTTKGQMVDKTGRLGYCTEPVSHKRRFPLRNACGYAGSIKDGQSNYTCEHGQ